MGFGDAIVLGIVQGLTEFIPVSSSGHLILARDVLGMSLDGSLAFDAVLHLATALAVLVYFRRDILNLLTKAKEHVTMWWALILGTIPALVLGLLFENAIEAYVRSSSVVAGALIAGSLLFVIAEWVGKQNRELSKEKGFMIGIFQSLALIPGISRAGASISGGLLFGLTREKATRFAFLLGFPILFGVGVSKLMTLLSLGQAVSVTIPLLASSVVAFVVGLGAIHWMLVFLKQHTLYGFAVYRVLLAVLVLLFL